MTNIFQRNLLRKIINTKWPRKITNENLYKITNSIPWDIKIRKRRLRWLGHLMRLHPETPVRKSLSEFIKPDKKPKGRPKTNWIQIICNDLKYIINFKDLENGFKNLEQLCKNRDYWRNLIERLVLREVAK